jgi:membrane-bound ClpP family serine protease
LLFNDKLRWETEGPGLYYLIAISAVFVVAATSIVLASRHKKITRTNLPLIFASALVDKPLTPKGTILVNGELWSAYSLHGNFITPGKRVTVVGLRNHLLLVKD